MKNNLKRLFLPAVALVSMCLTTGCDGALPGGGISTRDKLTQKEITREQAKVVGNDIDAKQKDAYKGGSESKSAIRLAPMMAKDYTGDYDSWSYGESYDWGDWEDGNYQDNWSYQRQADEDEWGYKDTDDYDTWFSNRAKTKKAEMPKKVFFSIYASNNNIDLKSKKQDKGSEEIIIEFDLDKYFIHEHGKMEGNIGGSTSSSPTVVDAYMFYKDGYLYQLSIEDGKLSNNGCSKMALSEGMISAYFSVISQYAQEFFSLFCTGSAYLSFIDMFKEAGFDCKYGSNDAGNLEMIIKGQDMTDLGSMMGSSEKSSVSLDASFVWDQYFMRSMELHMSGATIDKIMENHAKIVFNENCTPSYPDDSLLSTVKEGIIGSL